MKYPSVYKIKEGSFFESSLLLNNRLDSIENFYTWYNKILNTGFFEIEIINFDEFDNWSFLENKDSLVHVSGKFFRIEGIHVKTNFGNINEWYQPIINQPEIGLLGIITKVNQGIRYFLMQVKMEPGNVNILQLSPTVQATKSNFTKVHKGKTPPYLDYFTKNIKSKILIDQLQTEQGGRFLQKRNRNVIVEVDSEIFVEENFIWLSLAEIKILLSHDNIVNMDARSVISTIPLIDENLRHELEKEVIESTKSIIINDIEIKDFGLELLKSASETKKNLFSEEELISWYTQQKIYYELEVTKVSLSKLKNWEISNSQIFSSDRFFSVIGVKVNTGLREVSSWTQPLIYDKSVGLLGFIVKPINGVLHFLIQAKVEPGNIDIIELSPTVSCSNYEFIIKNKIGIPFFQYFHSSNKKTHLDVIQSEEGGRFYHMQNRNMIIELNEDQLVEIPNNFIWMTLNQVMNFMKFGYFNIEARSIISSLKFF